MRATSSLAHKASVQSHAEDAHLARCTATSTPRFVPDVRRGKVVSVYDGDTLTVAARLGGQGSPYLFSVRLLGIDTPEIRGAASAEEKSDGLAARDALRAAVLGEMVSIAVAKHDKYGRLLATITHEGVGDLSRLMLEQGHAVVYDGGERRGWRLWSSSDTE